MRSLRYRVIAIILTVVVVITVFTPQKSLSVPLFEAGGFFASFLNSQNMFGIFAQGIGGLEARIESSLVLNPSDLSYRDGYLYANIEHRQVQNVKVSPKILREAIRVVQQTDKSSFQVSQDVLAGKNHINYTDEALRSTKIGKLFLDADGEFAWMVWGDEQLLKNTPESKQPNFLASQLLKDNNSDYARLLKNWILPPLSWPQIILSFNPNSEQIPGLVSLEFKPQVTFLSPYGHPIQANEEEQTLGELPYKPLIEDVKARPNAYREALHSLNDAASITATMGLVAAGCRQPKSCNHLQLQSWIYGLQPKTLINDWTQKDRNSFSRPRDFLGIISQNESGKLLKYQWLEHSLKISTSKKEKEEKDKWDAPYNAVLQSIEPMKVAESTETIRGGIYRFGQRKAEKMGDIDRFILNESDKSMSKIENAAFSVANQSKELAQQYFGDYKKVPQDSLLQSALAVVDAWNRDSYAAEKDLESAIKHSADYPGNRSEVTRMGLAVASIMQDSKEKMKGNWIKFRMNYLRRKALRASYDLVDDYLKSCEKKESKQSKCSINNLLNLEANATRAGLYEEDVQGRDIAWLYGRFAYLVGVKLLHNQPEKAKDRLRFLSSYAKVANPWHSLTLRRWENDLRKRATT